MGVLQDEFDRASREWWTGVPGVTKLLQRVLKNRELSVPDALVSGIAQRFLQGERICEIPGGSPDEKISISEEDFDQALDELLEVHVEAADGPVMRDVEKIWPSVLKSLYKTLPKAMRGWRAARRAFEKRIYKQWKRGLDRLDMLVHMADESREEYVKDLQREPADGEDSPEPVLMEVLVALHGRAVRTAKEVVCLLKAGFADGAHARWRSLHELAVTAFFIHERRGDTPQRYLDHAAVEGFRAAEEYQQHCQQLGEDPFSDEEMDEMKKASELMVAKYGTPFKGDYGWAAGTLGMKRPTFSDIESNLDMAHWRPYFRLACRSVHAGSRGMQSSLGVPHAARGLLLVGASNAGLCDPGHQMALSLTMTTVAVLTAHPNIDSLVSCQCMLQVCDDIGKELIRVHEAMEEELDRSFDSERQS